jgi:ribose transport system substrate-binding protein
MVKTPFLLASMAALLLCASCEPRPHDPRETYILVAANTRIPYWQTALAGLNAAGKEMKVTVEMVGPKRYDPKAERDELLNAIAEKPAGILVSAADANLLTPDINNALQQGIPVITMDADAPNSKRLFFVGTDNYTAGRLGGERLAKLLGGKGNVVMFSYPNQHNLTERQHGYESVFEDYPDIKVTKAVDIQGDPAIAFTTAKEVVDSKAKVDAFVCMEAVACPEVGEVISQANLTGKTTIMAMDTDQRTLKWIQDGVVAATIAQKPYTMAYLGVKLLDDVHHHPPTNLLENFAQNSFSPLPAFVDTGAFIVDKANAASFAEQNRAHGLGQ